MERERSYFGTTDRCIEQKEQARLDRMKEVIWCEAIDLWFKVMMEQ